MQPHLSMVTLGVADVAKATTFYRDGLGLPVHMAEENVAFFNLAGAWLGLFGRQALAEDACWPQDADKPLPEQDETSRSFPGVSLAHNVDSPETVDAVLAQAVAAGAKLLKPGQKVFWGGYSGYFMDPDGHLWEVAHNPFMAVGPTSDK